MSEPALSYCGMPLDRGSGALGDPGWVSAMAQHQDTVLVPMWRDSCFVDALGRPVLVRSADADPMLATEQVFLGMDNTVPVFAVELGGLDERIVLVEAPRPPMRCLLARHRGSAEGSFATLAGFVEIGENLEEAARREIAEETGIRLGDVTYQASQTWPFPSGLMVGCRGQALDETISVDEAEIIEARWFTTADLAQQITAGGGSRKPFKDDSIDRFLVQTWMREQEARPTRTMPRTNLRQYP